MQNFKREAVVTVSGLMNAEGEDDRIEVISRGVCYRKGGAFFILYEEEDPDLHSTIRNIIKVTADHVDVRKRGLVDADLSFERGCMLNSYYNTPYGRMEVGIFTENMDFREDEDGIRLELLYELDMNHRHVSENRLYMKAEYN